MTGVFDYEKQDSPPPDVLTGWEYMNMSPTYLTRHPDYQQHAHRVCQAISQMTSDQLVKVDISKAKS